MEEAQARQAIEKAGGSWDVFCEWMTGQTLGKDEDGETDFYDTDVERFIFYKCDPTNEPMIDFD